MFGVVCENPVTGCVEPWTIAGPTDGSTNIVHHDENRDYQLATANDCQYGASYLGITDCCKPLYNPTTGNLTVDCATTTATGVDVNADDNVDVAHPIIAQNYDCDDTEFKNKLIKASCFNYNPQCYVCNDPVTGDPVRKPVVHIGTLCADEYLGFNEGLPRRTNVCEDCWRQIPFIGEDNGEETLDTTWSCDAFRHNSCTCTTQMKHLELADICSRGDIYVGDRSFNPNQFAYCERDVSNTFNVRAAGFLPTMSGGGFHICDINATTSCTKYKFSLTESSSAIGTNALTISPTGNAALCLNLNYIPLTANTETANYELVGLNVSNSQLKKLDGFSYNPVTCTISGNFNVTCMRCDATSPGTGYSIMCVEPLQAQSEHYETEYCNSCITQDSSGIRMLVNDRLIGTSIGELVGCFPSSCSRVAIAHDFASMSSCRNDKRAYVTVSDSCLIYMCSCCCTTGSSSVFIAPTSVHFGIEAGANSTGFGIYSEDTAIAWSNCKGIKFCNDNKIYTTVDEGTTWTEYAPAAQSPINIIPSQQYCSWREFTAAFVANKINTAKITFDNEDDATDTHTGKVVHYIDSFTGQAVPVTADGCCFSVTGTITTSDSCIFQIMATMLKCTNIDCSCNIISISPIPGTMYGTASVSGINVEGTV